MLSIFRTWRPIETIGVVCAVSVTVAICWYGWAITQAKPLKADFRDVAADPEHYHLKRVPRQFFVSVAERLSPRVIVTEQHGIRFALHLEDDAPANLASGQWISFTGVFHNSDGGYFVVDRLTHHPRRVWKFYVSVFALLGGMGLFLHEYQWTGRGWGRRQETGGR